LVRVTLLVLFSYRDISILDATTGSIARAVECGHSRAVHHIALPRPSVHVPLSPDAYNCFLTAATDNAIRLWDLRAPSSVSLLNAHVNRREAISCDISPACGMLPLGAKIRQR
jgi:WD40 repeat protein